MKQSRFLKLLFLYSVGSILIGCEQYDPPVATWEHTLFGTYDSAISSSGRYALVAAINFSGPEDKTAAIDGAGFWDLEKNARIFTLFQNSDHDDAIIHTAISPGACCVITATHTTFALWNANNGDNLRYWKMPTKIRDVALSYQGRYVLVGLDDGTAEHIDLLDNTRLQLTWHNQPVLDGKFNKRATSKSGSISTEDGYVIIDQDGEVYTGDNTAKERYMLKRTGAVNSVDISANGRYALTAGDDNYAVFWDTKAGGKAKQRNSLRATPWPHQSRVHLAKFSLNGKYAFTAASQGENHIWSLVTAKAIQTLHLKRRQSIATVQFSKDERYLVTGSAAGLVQLWSVTTGKELQFWYAGRRGMLIPRGANIDAVGFSPDNRHVLAETSNGLAYKWAIRTATTKP